MKVIIKSGSLDYVRTETNYGVGKWVECKQPKQW